MLRVFIVESAHEVTAIIDQREVHKLRAEIREMCTGTGSPASLAKAWQEGENLPMNAEDIQLMMNAVKSVSAAEVS